MEPPPQARIDFVFIIGCAMAPLSILGSTMTLRAIYYQGKAKGNLTTYQRLLMGISTFDFLLSAALAFGPLPIPKEYAALGIPGAHGNTKTCTTQGFFTQLGTGSFAYSQMLMLYYVLVIRYNLPRATIEKWVEPFLHAIPILYYGITSIAGLFLQVLNFGGTSCWVGPVPLGCDEIEELECTRPRDGHTFFLYDQLTSGARRSQASQNSNLDRSYTRLRTARPLGLVRNSCCSLNGTCEYIAVASLRA